MKVLLVEDDAAIADFVTQGLKQAGYVCEAVRKAEEALALSTSRSFDAMIVDIMLPGMDGLSFIDRIRANGDMTPIIVLSAKRSVDDRIKGFQRGGDDYLTKPFSFQELLVRLQALVRRSQLKSPETVLRVGDLSIDIPGRVVRRGDSVIELQPREYSLLEYLARHADQVLSKTMIMEHVWNYDFDPQTNVVDVLVSRLRSKIDKDFEPRLIHTVRGVGYVLRTPDR